MIGFNIPTDYINHLLVYNGGECTPNIFMFYQDGKRTRSQVDWFLAIYDGESDNLIDYIQTFKVDEKRMPVHMLPIAHDPLGNLICISCGHRDVGNIYFWDHEREVDYNKEGDENYSNLYLVAENFKTFLEGLVQDTLT